MFRVPNLLAFIGCLAALAAPSAHAAPKWYWYHYVIDTNAVADGYSKIRYDKNGVLRMLYRSHSDLYYLILSDKGWTQYLADTAIKYEAKIALGLDADGNPHILHQNYAYSQIWYDAFDGKDWFRKRIDTLTLHGPDYYNLNIAVDSKGTSHLLYTTEHLTYNTCTYATVDKNGNENTPVLAAREGGGKWNSLVLDENEDPVISYFVYGNSALTLGYRKGGSWVAHYLYPDSNVNTFPYQSFYNYLRQDKDGTYYILTNDRAHGKIQLLHGRKEDSVWTNEVIDTLRGNTQFSTQQPWVMTDSMFFVTSPRVTPLEEHVPKTAQLWMAYRSRKDSSGWQYEAVDTAGVTGMDADMTLTPEGLPAISYYDWGRHRVLLAVARVTEPVDADHNGILDYQENLPKVTRLRPVYKIAPNGVVGKERLFRINGQRVPGARGLKHEPGVRLDDAGHARLSHPVSR